MKNLIKLAVSDFKVIFRDKSLKTFFVLPILIFALFIWFLPDMIEKYPGLAPYIPVFIVVGVVENIQTFCFINSMVLLDEKETGVASVYGIVPFSKFEYFSSRFLIPFIFTALLNVLFLEIQPFYSIDLGTNILIACCAAFIIPPYTLGVNTLSSNRMQGLVIIKALNVIILIPVAAFFVSDNFQFLFYALPTHWVFQSITAGINGGSIGIQISIAFSILALLTLFTSRYFIRKHFV